MHFSLFSPKKLRNDRLIMMRGGWLAGILMFINSASTVLTEVHSCPRKCRCGEGKWIEVRCNGQELKRVPYGIPLNTYKL